MGLALVAGALTAVTGCGQSPVKMGAAAIVADQRITTAEVQDAVSSFREAQQRSPIPPTQLQLPDPQSLPRSELMLLLRFRIADEASRSEGITVSEPEIDAFISKQGSRRNLELAALAGGIPPVHLRDAVREALVRQQLAQRIAPDANPQEAALRVHEYLGRYARGLGIAVSPRYGHFDYKTLTVAPTGANLSRPESPAPS